MKKNKIAVLVILLFAISFLTTSYAQDADKKMAKKTEMKEMGIIKQVACDPACGFKCQSRDEAELTSAVKKHAKKFHKMELTDAQVKEKMTVVKN